MFLDIQKQLEEKEKEIDEFKRIWEKCHISDLLEDKRKENKILVKTIEQTNQDKISFALEQLEKVKENIHYLLSFDYNLLSKVNEQFDNQIKQLKEMK